MQQQEINRLFGELKEQKVQEEDVKKAVSSLTGEQKKQLDEAMSSPQKLKELLNTKKAQELLNLLKGNN